MVSLAAQRQWEKNGNHYIDIVHILGLVGNKGIKLFLLPSCSYKLSEAHSWPVLGVAGRGSKATASSEGPWSVSCGELDMGGCQNYGPFVDPYCNTATNI